MTLIAELVAALSALQKHAPEHSTVYLPWPARTDEEVTQKANAIETLGMTFNAHSATGGIYIQL